MRGGGVLLASNKNTSSSGTLDSIFVPRSGSGKPLTNPFAVITTFTYFLADAGVGVFSCEYFSYKELYRFLLAHFMSLTENLVSCGIQALTK